MGIEKERAELLGIAEACVSQGCIAAMEDWLEDRATFASQEAAPVAAVPAPDERAEIMNIPCKVGGAVFANWTRDEQEAYTAGHRDACHAAIELVVSHQAAAPAQAVPDGWQLVPVKPTDDMVVAFAEAWYSKRRAFDDPEMDDAYAAMLAAAPQPPIDEQKGSPNTLTTEVAFTAALAHAGMYVEHHCVDGEKHAEAIVMMPNPYADRQQPEPQCTHERRQAGKPYPRTCVLCGLFGPCKKAGTV